MTNVVDIILFLVTWVYAFVLADTAIMSNISVKVDVLPYIFYIRCPQSTKYIYLQPVKYVNLFAG